MFIENHFVQCLAPGCIFLPHRDSCACVLKHQKLAAFRSLFSGTVGKEEKDEPCQKRHICSLSDSEASFLGPAAGKLAAPAHYCVGAGCKIGP